MMPTESAGHARVLALEAAQVGRPLIVSVSGDGGYNEVVDGVMRSGNPDVICAVMAAGHANDHRRTTRQRPLAEAVAAGDVRRVDLPRLSTGIGPGAQVRYAHSQEIGSVLQTFSRFRPFTIELEDGTRCRFDSLLFANIAQMAKYATLSDDGRPTTASSR